MSASAISAALIGQGSVAGNGAVGFATAVAGTHKSKISTELVLNQGHRRKQQNIGGVKVTSGSKASAETVAKNFLNSMKGLASGFFD